LLRIKVNNRITALILTVALVLSAAFARGAENEVDHFAQVLDLRPGSSVADVGAGSGELSIAIARYVGPKGVVYSTEINPKLLDKIRGEALRAGARNLIPILGEEHDAELPDNCCDAIFLRRVYHHLTDPLGIDRSLYKAMRPGGRLAIIDFEPSERPGEPVPPGVPANRGGHGAPMRVVAEELSRTGFEPLRTMNWPTSGTVRHYCMLFRKPKALKSTPTIWHENAPSPFRRRGSLGNSWVTNPAIPVRDEGGMPTLLEVAKN
jgi:ubiquinone/menaquinone biosynthesis C-methylase UbiE